MLSVPFHAEGSNGRHIRPTLSIPRPSSSAITHQQAIWCAAVEATIRSSNEGPRRCRVPTVTERLAARLHHGGDSLCSYLCSFRCSRAQPGPTRGDGSVPTKGRSTSRCLSGSGGDARKGYADTHVLVRAGFPWTRWVWLKFVLVIFLGGFTMEVTLCILGKFLDWFEDLLPLIEIGLEG